jgi:hypothetical protein
VTAPRVFSIRSHWPSTWISLPAAQAASSIKAEVVFVRQRGKRGQIARHAHLVRDRIARLYSRSFEQRRRREAASLAIDAKIFPRRGV